MRYSLRTFFVVALSVVLSACGGGSGVTPAPTGTSGSGTTFNVDGFAAHFTEYPLPSGIEPFYDVVGPDGAVWFSNSSGSGRITSGGAIALFGVPSDFTAAPAPIGSNSGDLFTIGYASLQMDESFILQTTTAGLTTAVQDFGTCCRSGFNNVITGPDGALWFAASNEGGPNGFISRFNPKDGTRGGTAFVLNGQPYSANAVGSGSDGNLWVTSNYGGTPPGPPSDSSVWLVSTASKIVNHIQLPNGSFPQGVVAGPDKNMWIVERGTNKIGRMTTGGSLTEFTIPTPNAGAQYIIAGTDGALWFTEQNASQLGRITTSGSFSEFPIPTANSQPFDLATCPTACENAHGRIWITEEIGKLAKFEF